MNSRIWRVCMPALFAFLAACSGKDDAGVAGNEADATKAGPALVASGTSVSTVQRKNLDQLVDLIVAEANELPRAEFDPAALAKQLGTDPQTHFEWVRDHTWWVPYRGLLRGPQGVMLDRVGSNLDRAVLLGDLLRHSGHNVRLAHAVLPENRVRDLLGKVQSNPEQRRNAVMSQPVSAERRRRFEAIFPGYEKTIETQMAESRRLAAEAAALIQSQSRQLHAAAMSAANPAARPDERGVIAAMRDHWWIEREDHGKWVAMDVLLQDAAMGATLATATAISEWKADARWPAVPESDWHAVQLRLVIERYADGIMQESTPLDTTLRPAELLGRSIMLKHLPEPWPNDLPDRTADPNALGNTATSVREWVPYLQIGDEYIVQSAFTEGGDLKASPLSAQSDISEVGGGSLFGGFDTALSGSDGAASHMTAEWLDYEIRVPGSQPERLRRPLFDLLGPAQRGARVQDFDATTNERMIARYEALLGTTEILLQPCDFTAEFVTSLALDRVVASQPAVQALLGESDRAKVKERAATLRELMAGGGPLPYLALWRSDLADRPGERFVDRPNVLNYRISQTVVQSNVEYREVLDIVSNGMGVRRDSHSNSFGSLLNQGVVDTVAEVLSLSGEFDSADNAAAVFMAVGAAPENVILVAPRDADAVTQLGWPEDVAARLEEDISAGYLAIVPAMAAQLGGQQRLAWWRIDATSGETIGVMDTGLHGMAMSEKAALDDMMEVLAVRLRAYAGNQANARWVTTARDFLTRPGVRSLGRADMDRLAMHTKLMRLYDTLVQAGYLI
jgi:hypothetical protein